MKKKLLSVLVCFYCLNLNSQAIWGTTGLLHMPTANMQKDRTFMFGGNMINKSILPPRWNNKDYNHTYNYYINITFLPWLEIAYTCTLVKGREAESTYWPQQTWGKFVNQDRNFSARIRLWKEGYWKSWTPQIVIGSNDPGSFNSFGGGTISLDKDGQTSHHFNRYYIAATKNFIVKGIGYLGIHSAYCYSIKNASLRYTGIACGTNFQFNLPNSSFFYKTLNGLNLMAEYDTRHINIGFNYQIWKDLINIVTEFNNGKYISTGIYCKVHLK